MAGFGHCCNQCGRNSCECDSHFPGLLDQRVCQQPYFLCVGLLTTWVPSSPNVLSSVLLLTVGKEFIPQLQRVVYPHHASVHETGLWQDAHRFQ